MKKLCIYHGNCADGFGAAWVVRRALGNGVEFHKGVYTEAPPDVTDREVIMVDFSYKRPVLLELAKQAKSILILDHHASAERNLVDLPPNVMTVFDMTHSGAMLAWLHYFPREACPQLLKHIEDRDLWKFDMPHTKEIQAALFSYPYQFSVWDQLMKHDTGRLCIDGEAIRRAHEKNLHELLPQVTREMVIADHRVPVANLPYTFSSDAANQLAERELFAACYWDTPKGRSFSLRSVEGGLDVSKVAEQYGGGGHEHAAGFTVDYATAATFEVSHE